MVVSIAAAAAAAVRLAAAAVAVAVMVVAVVAAVVAVLVVEMATAQHCASEPPRLSVSFPIYINLHLGVLFQYMQVWDFSLHPQFPSMELPQSAGDAPCEAIRFGV